MSSGKVPTRPGSVVRVGTGGASYTSYQLQSRAGGGGWWAIPTGGGKPVRLRYSSRTGQWRVSES